MTSATLAPSLQQVVWPDWMETSMAAVRELVVQSASAEKDYDYHKTVLLDESIHFVTPESTRSPLIVDGTCGGAGHTGLLLEKGARVIAIDRDPQALAQAEGLKEIYGDKLTLVEGNFADLEAVLSRLNVAKVDGILVDLGVSSWQLDEASRGFSFMRNGPLDMRMGRDVSRTAADLVNQLPEEELARIIYVYGEDKASRRIAGAICRRRLEKPFAETLELADCVCSVVRKTGKTHPATRTFQALRIAVNGELDAVESLLRASQKVLNPGGRLAVISFHSLEDRLVKHFLRSRSEKMVDRPEWPEPRPNPDYTFDLVMRKPILASAEELAVNPRSRSAKLRVGQRISPNE